MRFLWRRVRWAASRAARSCPSSGSLLGWNQPLDAVGLGTVAVHATVTTALCCVRNMEAGLRVSIIVQKGFTSDLQCTNAVQPQHTAWRRGCSGPGQTSWSGRSELVAPSSTHPSALQGPNSRSRAPPMSCALREPPHHTAAARTQRCFTRRQTKRRSLSQPAAAGQSRCARLPPLPLGVMMRVVCSLRLTNTVALLPLQAVAANWR